MKHLNHLAPDYWRHYKRVPFIGTDPIWRSWLLDQGSLTDRLIKASDGDFSVQILHQGWQRPQRSEAQRLGIKPAHLALVREVQLLCQGEPWVYARSIFPQATLTGKLRFLKKLDNRSLGTLLFKDPSMKRTLFEVTTLESQRIRTPSNSLPKTTLWGRRSLFYVKNKPILVAEFFLPPLAAYLKKVQL